MKPQCTGWLGRFFGHNYQPCYSTGEPTVKMADMNNVFSMVFSSDMAGVIAASKPRTYHGHVCLRCGDEIRGESSSGSKP